VFLLRLVSPFRRQTDDLPSAWLPQKIVVLKYRSGWLKKCHKMLLLLCKQSIREI
jgi:hypothetical protein